MEKFYLYELNGKKYGWRGKKKTLMHTHPTAKIVNEKEFYEIDIKI